LEKPFDPKVIVLLAEEILFRQRLGSGVSFDDLMHLAELARELRRAGAVSVDVWCVARAVG